ncbi:hypothetical protein KY316_02285 [Candidatus Woesearchaeota archaeon]|nr:hypothetical protein [Candidatus Woesearchaeota archaeon]
MKKYIVLLALLLLPACAVEEQKITEDSFSSGLVVLSAAELDIDAGQTADFFIGLENSFDSEVSFSIDIECVSQNCENNVVVQAFPSVRLAANKKAAFPARIVALDTAEKADYEFTIKVSAQGSEYGSQSLKVVVKKNIEELAEEALAKL